MNRREFLRLSFGAAVMPKAMLAELTKAMPIEPYAFVSSSAKLEPVIFGPLIMAYKVYMVGVLYRSL